MQTFELKRVMAVPHVTLNLFVIAFGIVAVAGCTPIEREAPTLPTPTMNEEAKIYERTPLPGVAGQLVDLPSGPPPTRPDLCAWADSVDAIVFGTLKSFDLTMTPWVPLPPDGITPNYDAPCEQEWQNPTLRFLVHVEDSMKGDLQGDQIVYAPINRLGKLLPSPRLADDGAIYWVGVNDEPKDAPIHVGQKLGFALHYVAPHDVHTAMFEPFFGHDEAGAPIFQPGDASEPYQWFRAPDLSAQVDKLSEVKAAIAASCDGSSVDGATRRMMMRRFNAEEADINDLSPVFSFAAACYDTPLVAENNDIED
jgi:hypothetical protein